MEAGQLAADVLHETRLVGAGRGEREGDHELGDVVGPVLGDGEQQQRETRPRVLVEPSEQAEVEEGETPVVRQEDVSRVGVGVVHALDDDLEHIGAEELSGQVSRAFWIEPVPRLDLASRDSLQDECALAHVRLDHTRDDQSFERLDELPHELRVVRLLDEVELCAEMNLELVRELLELDPPRRLGVSHGEADRRAQHGEIEVDLLDDQGTPHLDDHVVSRSEQPAMRLGDRGRRERLRLEAHEGVRTEVGDHHRLDLRERDRRHAVDQACELLDVDVGQEIGTRREELPELDERGPELLETAAERPRPLARGVAASDHADLGEDPPQSALVCDPPDGKRAPSPL